MNNLRFIENKAKEVIEKYSVFNTPIDVFKIAENLGLEIRSEDLGVNVSGVLLIKNNKGIIGYNEKENVSSVRKRFTIAHEIGHYILHSSDKNLFVDHKNFKAIYRDSNSAKGEIMQEKEANAFAAALLMPKKLIRDMVDNENFDFFEESTQSRINILAKEFKVSGMAMSIRLSNMYDFY